MVEANATEQIDAVFLGNPILDITQDDQEKVLLNNVLTGLVSKQEKQREENEGSGRSRRWLLHGRQENARLWSWSRDGGREVWIL